MSEQTFEDTQVIRFDHTLPEYSPDAKHRMFVYGTLKEGFGNHRVLFGADNLGTKNTVDSNFLMVGLGQVPAVVDYEDGFRIVGELYEVNGPGLLRCDYLEGNGMLYNRKLVQLEGETEPAWMYVLGVHPGSFGPVRFDGVVKATEDDREIGLYWVGIDE